MSGMDLNTFDVLLLVFVGLLVLLGVLRGLMRLLIGAVALIAAFVLATRFHEQVAVSMVRVVEMTEPTANLVAYLAIFLGTMLAGGPCRLRAGAVSEGSDARLG